MGGVVKSTLKKTTDAVAVIVASEPERGPLQSKLFVYMGIIR